MKVRMRLLTKAVLCGSLLSCGALALFVLPFYVGTGTTPMFSTAWAVGADNRAAYLAVTALSVAAALLFWMLPTRTGVVDRGGRTVPDRHQSNPDFGYRQGWLIVLSMLIACWSLGWGSAIVRSKLRVGETNYFLEQTRNAAGIGLPEPMRIYKDLEFPYGPLLLEAPVWLWHAVAKFGVSVASCYVLTLAAFNIAGFMLLVYILKRLPTTPASRGVFAACSAFVALNPLFGPNYSLFKFLWPVAVLIAAAQCSAAWRRTVISTAGIFLMLMISPELAVGLSAAVIATEIVNIRVSRQRSVCSWLIPMSPLIALGLFITCYGVTFLERLRQANAGALNLVIQPMPDVLVFLVVAVWLAPEVTGKALSIGFLRQREGGAVCTKAPPASTPSLIVGLFILSLGMLPGALGRADPLHVFFNGLPLWLLSLVAVQHMHRRARRMWLLALVVLTAQVQADNFHFYARSLRDVVLVLHHPPVATLDVARLAAVTGQHPVTAPVLYAIPLSDEMLLRAKHMLRPTSAPGLAEVWNEASEDRRIQEIRQTEWALVPKASFLQAEHAPGSAIVPRSHEHSTFEKRLLRKSGQVLFGFHYKEKQPAYVIGTALQRELSRNWKSTEAFGDLLLYRRWQ